MTRVKDGPTIHIRRETHKELGRVKNDLELKSFDETITNLLSRPEFTEDELKAIRYMCGIIENPLRKERPDLIEGCKGAAGKAHEALNGSVNND